MAKMVANGINVGPTIMCGRARGHSLFADVPEDKGGTDTAMLPPEMLCAALANCIGMVIALTCRDEGIECAGMTVDVEAQPNEEQARLEKFTVVVKMPGTLSDEQRAKVEEAASQSKVRGTVAAGTDLSLTIE